LSQPSDCASLQVLATIDSPELYNEYQREHATLDSLNAALSRQEIEIRRQLLTSKQQADLAQVAITAAERELKRAQWAWDQRAMSERAWPRAGSPGWDRRHGRCWVLFAHPIHRSAGRPR
jgi:HlyD family secretion protein